MGFVKEDTAILARGSEAGPGAADPLLVASALEDAWDPDAAAAAAAAAASAFAFASASRFFFRANMLVFGMYQCSRR